MKSNYEVSNLPLNKENKKASSAHIARALALGAVFTSCYAATAFGQEGIVNTDNAIVRTEADPDASVINFLNAGESVEITSIVGDYYQVTINGQEHLYMHTNFLDVENSETTAPVEADVLESSSDSDEVYASGRYYALVNSDNGLNLRSGSSMDDDVLMALADGVAVDIVDSWPVWTKVSFDGTVGFMKTEYLDVHTGQKPEQPEEQIISSNIASGLATQVIAYGKNYLGTPYVWGGTTLGRGVDCSGFVYSVYNHFGVYLNRSSSGMASNGVRVSKDNLRTGDLVLFDTNGANNGQISHVGIYIGDGMFIHSSSGRSTHCVTISSLDDSYYQRTYVTARRVI